MTERLNPEQAIDNNPVNSPDLHFVSNYHNFINTTDSREQYKYIDKLREKYGAENVKVSLAMIDGKATAIPEMFGIYVDAQKWAELNPDQ